MTLADFEIFEDGKKMEISHFYAFPGVSTLPAQDGETPDVERVEAAPEKNELPDIDYVEAAPAQDLYLVVYFDDTNLYRGRRQAERRKLA